MVKNKTVQLENSNALSEYKAEMEEELIRVLSYWMEYTIDEEDGGFYGSVSNDNIPDNTAPKGIVLNSRILWTFSTAFLYTNNKKYLEVADRAYHYIAHHFIDHEFGGVYWSVDHRGKMLDGKKQVYGLAFCIYGLTEYYKASNDDKALLIANEFYEFIEKYSHDKKNGGYLEAYTRDWQLINDLRLSDKDENEKKTANTHLHVIEAYTNLYSITQDATLGSQISGLLGIFSEHFINRDTYHLHLFLDESWNVRSTLVSYGHDIEAAWLLLQCAETLGDEGFVNLYKQLAIKITDAAAEALDKDGGLWYEYESKNDHLIKEKHSWPQAEAMIGFMNAYQLSADEKYLKYSLNSWEFIKRSIKDNKNGEWFWGVDENNNIMPGKDKAGFWKCPYHSTRAFLEIIKRIDQLSGK